MKRFFLVAALAGLVGCGGGSGGGGGGGGGSTDPCDALPARAVTGAANTSTIEPPVKLTVTGMNHNVTVSGAGDVCIDAASLNSMITLSGDVEVLRCKLAGSDNTLSHPAALSLSCDVGGRGNQIVTY